MKRASVCLATYNGARYLREQLDSILSQLGETDELIVSDDNSTDDTRSIVDSYKDARIHLIRNSPPRGHVRNFAHAMELSQGEFIVLSDQDDIWAEGRLEHMLAGLEDAPDRSLLVGDLIEFDTTGMRPTQQMLGPSPRSGIRQLWRLFFGQAKYFGSAYVFRRELLRYVLPIPAQVEAHDIWIAMNACLHGGVVHLQGTTLFRRIHGNNLSPERRRAMRVVLRSRVGYLRGLLQSSVR